MNWYRQIKLSQVTSRPPRTYMDIGHYDDPDSDCEEWLWLYDNGKIVVEEGMPGTLHENYWDEDLISSTWSGRYDDCSKRISIGVPPALVNKQIPSSLIRLLDNTFPEAVEFYSFAPDSPAQMV